MTPFRKTGTHEYKVDFWINRVLILVLQQRSVKQAIICIITEKTGEGGGARLQALPTTAVMGGKCLAYDDNPR